MANLRLRYYVTGGQDWAEIQTNSGWHVCEVPRCSGESKRAWMRRARALKDTLAKAPDGVPIPFVRWDC